MEIREMNLAEIEARENEIKSVIEERSGEELEALKAEVEELAERKKELKEIEERKAIAEKLNNGEIEPRIIESRGEKKMENIEVRDSLEYRKAFLGFIKTGKDEEVRSLLSDNVGGSVPVPTYLENEIKNAWEECKLASLCKPTSYKGNVKVGFEVSATGATVHVEGTDAPAEETLVWGTVELKAENIKKWITVSDEAFEGTTVDTINEIYKELAQRIVEEGEEIIVAKIVASPATTTATAPAVPVETASLITADLIVKAEGLLSGKAKNLHIAMNRQSYSAFVAVAMASNYAVDVFDGLKEKIVYTDALPAFGAAGSGDTYAIIGDFGYGFQINKPNGDNITIKIDEVSLAEKDLVKIVGKQFAGMGVVAPKAFVKINK